MEVDLQTLAPVFALLAGVGGTGYLGYDINEDLRASHAEALAAKQQTIDLKQAEIENVWARWSVESEQVDECQAQIVELQRGMADTIRACEVWR